MRKYQILDETEISNFEQMKSIRSRTLVALGFLPLDPGFPPIQKHVDHTLDHYGPQYGGPGNLNRKLR